jgi:hypothetical protein
VYSIDYEVTGTLPRVQELLAQLREDGTAEKAWKHTQDEFVRIMRVRRFDRGAIVALLSEGNSKILILTMQCYRR